jgi:putative heme-binding domain-containing protein
MGAIPMCLFLRRTVLAALQGAAAALIVVFVAWPASAQQRAYSANQIRAGFHLYVSQCQLCHAATGDGIAGINLANQQFHTVASDDDMRRVITNGNPQGMPPFVLTQQELDELVAFVRSGLDQGGISFRLGDAARGAAVYRKAGCVECHRIAGVGAWKAPDLTDIGLLRRPSQILTSLRDPDRAMMPINRPITILTNDGHTIKGRRFDEDTFSVQLIDSRDQILSIPKSDIRRYDIGQTSDMPSYRGKLSDDEVADLLAYLVSLRG